MNPDQLRVTTLDPEHRILFQISYNKDTDELESKRMYNTLLGEDVKVRREYIEQNVTFDEEV